jgi:DNA-binding NarL/FixJ family response regulator
MESPLTKRQQQVLQAMRDGHYSDQQIADYLHISRSTVRNHLRLASKRTRIYGRHPLRDAAIKHGWLTPAGDGE